MTRYIVSEEYYFERIFFFFFWASFPWSYLKNKWKPKLSLILKHQHPFLSELCFRSCVCTPSFVFSSHSRKPSWVGLCVPSVARDFSFGSVLATRRPPALPRFGWRHSSLPHPTSLLAPSPVLIPTSWLPLIALPFHSPYSSLMVLPTHLAFITV